MKIVDIVGGLGNQMFSYAFAIALQNRFPHEQVKIDVSSYSSYALHNGLEIERIFDVKLQKATKEEISKLSYYSKYYKIGRIKKRILPRKDGTCYEFPLEKQDRKALYTEGDKYYEGYWQDYRYFHYYYRQICDVFQFKIELPPEVEHVRQQILNSNSVCVHIRRGDYLKDKMYQGCCDLDYYQRAIKYIRDTEKKPHFFIFSNDIHWCIEHIVPLLGDCYTIVDCNRGTESYRDLQLMSCGKLMIIANSSFSWWAAYLNKTTNLKVIAPILWSNNMRSYDRQLPEWLRM